MAFSRLYQTAVLGPLAEQLVAIAGVVPATRALDVGTGSVLTRRLTGAVSPGGSVCAVCESESEARTLREELDWSRAAAEVVVATFDALPFADREFDAALSMSGVLGTEHGPPALAEMERTAASVAVLTYGQRPPTTELLLARAWRQVAGVVPPLPVVQAPPGWSVLPVRDVARFDSARQLWDSIATAPRGDSSDVAVEHVRERFLALCGPYEGADGTLRLPVEFSVLRRERSAGKPGR